MGTIFFTWELGAGLGHVMMISPIARALAGAGHRVVVAAKHVETARTQLGGEGIEIIGTPAREFMPVFARQQTFAHVLANVGFGDDATLEAQTRSWREIYEGVRPDVIVLQDSPMALLSAQGVYARRVIFGLSFFNPPDAYPLPAFRADEELDWEQLKVLENDLLARVNRRLRGWGERELERVSQLFLRADSVFLAGYPELDHYPGRAAANFVGTINDGDRGGIEPVWPVGKGRKIFAYLRHFPGLEPLLMALKKSGHPTLAFVPNMDPEMRERIAGGTIRCEMERLNMARVLAECDVGVCYGGVTTMASLLKAGKPVLVVPMTEEQAMLARRVHASGAGLGVLPDQVREFAPRLKLVVEREEFRTGAGRMAEGLKRIDMERKCAEMMERIEELLV